MRIRHRSTVRTVLAGTLALAALGLGVLAPRHCVAGVDGDGDQPLLRIEVRDRT